MDYRKWFAKLNSPIHFEHGLSVVAREFGIELSFASIYFAHIAGRKWRFCEGWLRHLDEVAKDGYDF